jgi:hydroxymethylbilane synthase
MSAVSEPLVLGTRGSDLALRQANSVRSRLEAAGYRATLTTISTRGDESTDTPISEIGDEAVFTKELDRALLQGDVDLAVHSLKDIPSRVPSGIALAAIGEREDPRDAFVAHPSFEGHLHDLPQGAPVATASLRRTAQLQAWRPDLAGGGAGARQCRLAPRKASPQRLGGHGARGGGPRADRPLHAHPRPH